MARRTLIIGLVAAVLVAAAARGQEPADRPRKGAATVGTKRHRGTTARAALPGPMHHQNTHGNDPWKSGNCVFASIAHTAKFQGLDGLADFHIWMQDHPGGGWPEKVDRMIAQKLGPDHGLDYAHVYGPDAFSVLEKAVADGLMPCVSLGYSERYIPLFGKPDVDHMVNLVHFDDALACILDNNFPGPEKLEWMPRAEFEARFQWTPRGREQGWALVFFSGTPQPPEPEPAP